MVLTNQSDLNHPHTVALAPYPPPNNRPATRDGGAPGMDGGTPGHYLRWCPPIVFVLRTSGARAGVDASAYADTP